MKCIPINKILALLFVTSLFSCGSEDDPVPENVAISNITATGFQVRWTATAEAVVVQVSEDVAFGQVTFNETFEDSPAVVTGLVSETLYNVRVQFSGGGNSFSETLEVTTGALAAPSSVSANSVIGDEFELIWTDTGAGTYELDVALDAGYTNFVEGFQALQVTANRVIVGILLPATDYFFRVRASDGVNSSAYVEGMATTGSELRLIFRSSAFAPGGTMPVNFSCRGSSPPLNWRNVPEGTESVALVMDDLDFVQGVLTHWIVYDIPPEITSLAEGASKSSLIPQGANEGTNQADGQVGYFGPCPPAGETHRYRFTLYALNKELNLGDGAALNGFNNAIDGAVLESTQLMGLYE